MNIRTWRKDMPRSFVLLSIGIGLTILIAGFVAGRYAPKWGEDPPAAVAADLAADDPTVALSIGYELLGWVLKNVSQVDKLLIVKTVTFDRPNKEIIGVMRQIAKAADNTQEEFDEFVLLPPQIEPRAKESRFGDVLRAATRQRSKSGLMERSPHFGKRMLLSQVQALSLIVSLSEELAKLDPNPTRKAWLGRVVRDYDQMYDVYVDLIEVADSD